MNNTVTIYTLAHPINKSIFYVGQTTMTLEKRLISHVTSNSTKFHLTPYIKAIIKDTGRKPEIESLDVGAIAKRKELEGYWIQQLASWGFSLLNKKHCHNKSFYPYVRRSTSLTNREKDAIQILFKHGDPALIAKLLGCSGELVRFYLKRKTLPVDIKDVIMKFYYDRAELISNWWLSYNKKIAV